MGRDMRGLVNRRFARRQAVNNRAPAFGNGIMHRIDFVGVVGRGGIVHFDEVQSPGGIQAEQGVVISPPGVSVAPHAVHVGTPAAIVVPVRRVGGMKR